VDQAHRLPTLTTVRVPDGVDAKAVTRRLLEEYNLEIGNGLGELSGQVWRIGLMGTNSRPENVETVLTALGQVLGR
jgi:alanine-glyoxylate transaminase/serine-glyoxylate transaminase/serine-pyruvate transaminase